VVRGIAVADGRAFVAAGSAGLRIYDVSHGGDPALLGSFQTSGYAEAVACSGTLALVADGPLGLRVIDVADPTRPTEVGSAFEGKQARAVAVRDHYALVAGGGAGLLVADIANPAQPVELATVHLAGHAAGIALRGSYAYVMDSWNGIGIVNIANPAQPSLAATYATPGWAVKGAVSGTTLAVADAYHGVRVLDISNPTQPVETGASETELGDVADVAIDGGSIWAADRHEGLRVIEGAAVRTVFDTFARSWSVALSGNYAYVAAMEWGLRIVDISDPARPQEVGAYPACNAASVTVSYPYAYLTALSCETAGFHVVNVSDPRNPKRAGFIPNSQLPMNLPRDHATVGAISYVTNEIGLMVIDAGDPAHPALAGFAPGLPGSATLGVAVRDRYAYVAQEGVGLLVFDVSNPHAPGLIASDARPNTAQDVALTGNYALVATMQELVTVDVSDPAHPHTVGSLGLGGRGISTDGSRAYLATSGTGIRALDASHPASMPVVASYRTPGYARKAVAHGDRIWIADAETGLWSVPTASLTTSSASPAIVPESPKLSVMHARSRPPQIPVLPAPPARNRLAVSRPAARASGSCVVSTPADAGAGSLRECLQTAGAGDTITFDPTVFPPQAPRSIWLSTPLPSITQGNLTIDASNAGAAIGVLPCGRGVSAPDITPLVVLSDGNRIEGLEFGCIPGAAILVTGGSSHNTIGGDRTVGAGPNGRGNLLRSGGIVLSGSGTRENLVIGNYFGVNPGGLNSGGGGSIPCVAIAAGASANTIGSATPGERNMIGVCGPGHGLLLTGRGTTDNVIIGNYLGVNVAGDRIACDYDPNCGVGEISIADHASRNRIGGTAPGERNVISGSGREGVAVGDFGTVDNLIVGNYIGTDASGTRPVPNAIFGIWLDGTASRTRIERNLISGNRFQGVGVAGDYNVIVGNLLGTDATGKVALGGAAGVDVPNAASRRNRIGGSGAGEGNVISGASEGALVQFDAPGTEENYLIGNLFGTDITGAAVPRGPAWSSGSAIEIWDGAKRNVLGGATNAEANLIAGSPEHGIWTLDNTSYNWILGNWIGASQDGVTIGNRRHGISAGGVHDVIAGNHIAANTWSGVSGQATIRGNAIHDNSGGGIFVAPGLWNQPPDILSLSAGSVSGLACAGCTVDVFSDSESQGGFFEGSTRATAGGAFTLSKPGGFQGPHLTATATSPDGFTSQFSAPYVQPAPPRLTLSMTHTGGPTRSYTLVVTNSPNASATSGPVTVTYTLSAGMALVSMSGDGWACQSNTCTRSDALAPGASYPPITVVVNVAANAPAHGTDQATVSGGGSASSGAFDSALGGAMAHLASQGGWETSLTLLNLSDGQAQAHLDFFDEGGKPLALPLPSGSASSADRTLAGNALAVLDSTGPNSAPLLVGSAQLSLTGRTPGLGAFAVFRDTGSGQEAAVPLESRNAGAYYLAFDNTGGLATGVALANLASAATVPVVIRDDAGAILESGTVELAAQGHTSFVLGERYPATAGKRGTMQFSSPAGGRIAALGLRFNNGALTTIPVFASGGPFGGGSLTHIAAGGSWQTLITLVNTGTSAAQAHLKFFDNDGAALPLTMNFPQSGASLNSANLDWTLAAGATLAIVLPGPDAQTLVTGSATLATDGAISGFAVFRCDTTGQEAVAPLEYRSPAAYVLAYDNTSDFATGLAVANMVNQDVAIPVILRNESGTAIGSATLSVPANGHSSFVLSGRYGVTANQRGSVEFDVPAGARISALGLRFTPIGAFTTIPVMAK
jgi:hypothetical protein